MRSSPFRSATKLKVAGRYAAEPQAHKFERTQKNRHIYNDQRWRELSARIRREEPCAVCGLRPPAVAVLYVDHIIELEDGGAPFDPANVQALCPKHHGIKTKAQAARRSWTPTQARLLAKLGPDDLGGDGPGGAVPEARHE